MDIETAKTFGSYALALVLISLVVDFAMRLYVPTNRLKSKFLTAADKYGWFWYLGALTTMSDYVVQNVEYRLYILVGIAIVSLGISLYRYRESIHLVREELPTIIP